MPWTIFRGDGEQASPQPWELIPPPPPWRRGQRPRTPFVAVPELVDAINAALHLRRPLLLTGPPGSGKSSVIEVIARELALGTVLRWHVTSKSTVKDALFDYDALGRLQAVQVAEATGTLRGPGDPMESHRDAYAIDRFVTLGPLGTALASRDKPRAVLIDEIDKSDLDLHGDLLNVFENGEFDIAPLVRNTHRPTATYVVRGADGASYGVEGGTVQARHFPVIVMTSNGERTLPAPFLRRCVSFRMPTPNAAFLSEVVAAHLGTVADTERELIASVAARVQDGSTVAVDQLLNVVHLLTGNTDPQLRQILPALLLAEIGDQ